MLIGSVALGKRKRSDEVIDLRDNQTVQFFSGDMNHQLTMLADLRVEG